MRVAPRLPMLTGGFLAVQGALYQAEAYKATTAALKSQMKAVKMSELEDVMDDVADLLDDASEITEVSLAHCAPLCCARARSQRAFSLQGGGAHGLD